MTDYSDLGPELPSQAPRLSGAEKIVSNAITTVTARYSMIYIAFLMTVIVVPGGAYGIARIINAQDDTAKKQEQMGRDFASLQMQVLNIVSSQLTNSKNMSDRIEVGEKVLNDRINAQANWMQQLSAKIDDITKYVYQKVR